jgi:murein L,D-transpeptidase YafK
MVRILKIAFVSVALILLAAAQSNLASRQARPQPSRPSALTLPLTKPHIVVKKGRRELLLYSNDKLLRTYHVGLGLSPVGDKARAGDRRTPEGDFYIFVKNDKSAFYLSLGLSYPNAPHAERGLRDRLINRSQYEAIIRALKARKTPPQNTRLGGDIYIHGNGSIGPGAVWPWRMKTFANCSPQ